MWHSGEILSKDNRGLMLPYGEKWRKRRKVLHSGFHARRSDTYRGIQILDDPKNWERHLQRRVDSIDEWIVRGNNTAMDYKFNHLFQPFPIHRLCRFDKSRIRSAILNSTTLHPLEDVKSRMEKGAIQDCLTTLTINEIPKNGMADLEVAYAVLSPFGAGIET
ncbi:hypothetical protein J3R83DRAFT_13771 [Lanmaoa asiatica]|nr:hypothetical protein J3R83DRAFT_13771 [Lanmaoa asiatica]